MKMFRKSHGKSFVRAREEQHETKLEGARLLRENLVHEEFRLDVKSVYDFRWVRTQRRRRAAVQQRAERRSNTENAWNGVRA